MAESNLQGFSKPSLNIVSSSGMPPPQNPPTSENSPPCAAEGWASCCPMVPVSENGPLAEVPPPPSMVYQSMENSGSVPLCSGVDPAAKKLNAKMSFLNIHARYGKRINSGPP